MAKVGLIETVKAANAKSDALRADVTKLIASIDSYIGALSKMKEAFAAQKKAQSERNSSGDGYQRRDRGDRSGGYNKDSQGGFDRNRGGEHSDRGDRNKGAQARPSELESKPQASTRTYESSQKNKNKHAEKNRWEDKGSLEKTTKAPKHQKHKDAEPEKPVKVERKKAFTMGDSITVKELSENIGVPVTSIIRELMGLGIMANVNQSIDYDTASTVAVTFDIALEHSVVKESGEDQLKAMIEVEDSDENLKPRCPIVTVMGHVDHGKTSILDRIRKTSVTATEAGGITQHIGAYQVEHNGSMITFLDTPGHEAFTTMRARGAMVTDIAVLVVAADDGVMPQTIEAINHAKAAGVPIVVAINKMDLHNANPERVIQELSMHDVLVEQWGGETLCVEVSAHTGEGIDELLEMIMLQADMLDLRANPEREASGSIIEAKLDSGRGPIATVLVQNGTLRVGDPIVAGTCTGKVRAMMNYLGRRVKEAGPGVPVEVTGLDEVPTAGDVLIACKDERLAKQVADERRIKERDERLGASNAVSLEELFAKVSEGSVKELNIIIKGDVNGSVEAVKQSLEKLSNDSVKVSCIHGAVGAITESDIFLAKSNGAIIIGFNVRPASADVTKLAEQEKIDVRLYRIIYNAIDDVQKAMKGMLDTVYKDVIIGHAEVRQTFKISGVGTIGGCYVTDGKMQRNAKITVVRDGIVIYEGEIGSLRRMKDDVKEVNTGYECGIGLANFNDIKEGDVFEAYIQQQVEGE